MTNAKDLLELIKGNDKIAFIEMGTKTAAKFCEDSSIPYTPIAKTAFAKVEKYMVFTGDFEVGIKLVEKEEGWDY